MKKFTTILVFVFLLLTALPMTAFAQCKETCKSATQKYSLCNYENCNTAGLHYHDNVCYSGHYIGDGHDYHQLCSVQGCTKAAVHEHDGVTCFPHTNGDGHSYHKAHNKEHCKR